MKILGVGLSRTGTKSLTGALQILGFTTLHNDRERLNRIIFGEDNSPDFRIYDDIHVVTDLPSAYFFRELLLAYPNAKAILTERETDSWLSSYQRHAHHDRLPQVTGFKKRLALAMGRRKQIRQVELYRYKIEMRNLVYGSVDFREFLHRKKYEEHNAAIKREIPSDRLLVMDIVGGDGWEKLCPFLGLDLPDVEFPHL